jgi:hypothetical protein
MGDDGSAGGDDLEINEAGDDVLTEEDDYELEDLLAKDLLAEDLLAEDALTGQEYMYDVKPEDDLQWLRERDHAKGDLVEIELAVEGVVAVSRVSDLHRFALASASTYFRSRIMRTGLHLGTQEVERLRETLTRTEVAVARRLLESIYTHRLPAQRLPELLATFQLAERWGMLAARRACARAVADLCAHEGLPTNAVLSVLTSEMCSEDVVEIAVMAHLARRGASIFLGDRSLGLLPSVGKLWNLLYLLGDPLHPNDKVLLMTLWAHAHKDAPDPVTPRGTTRATDLLNVFRSWVRSDGWGQLGAGYRDHILSSQPWSPSESELLGWRQFVQPPRARHDRVTFHLSQRGPAPVR